MPTEEGGEQGGGPFDRLFRSMFNNDDIDVQGEINKKLNQDEEVRKRSAGRHPNSLHQELMNQMMMLGGGAASTSSNSPFYQSSYQIHQDQRGVEVTIDVPVIAADNLKVQVLEAYAPNCVVQWSCQRRTTSKQHNKTSSFSERVRLGPSVDCDQLAANLSRGVLKLTAPTKQQKTGQVEQVRSIPITEHDK